MMRWPNRSLASKNITLQLLDIYKYRYVGERALRTESNGHLCFCVFEFSLFLFYFIFSDAAGRITQSQFLSDDTNLVSKNGGFVLRFFSTGNSTNRYLGIWYNNIPVRKVVWVAHRCNPIRDSSGVLMLNNVVLFFSARIRLLLGLRVLQKR